MYQTIIIAGHPGGDPELRYTPQGTPVCSFSVATNRKYTKQDGTQQEEVTWFRVSTWNRLAETCGQYLTKGRQVLVEGRLKPDPDTGGPKLWTGLKGESRASLDVDAVVVQFLDKAESSAGAEDEIPF
jgi:single-strand DNA-binding protein